MPLVNIIRQRIVVISLIFLTAFGIRLLVWNNKRAEAGQVQTRVTQNYKHLAGLIKTNGLGSLFDASSTTSDPDLLGHPPGYSLLLTVVYRIFGESDSAIQRVQIFCDSLCAVIILLVAAELLTFDVGTIAGFLAAVSPQFSWNSILLLPDTLAALPILIAVYLLARAWKRPSWLPLFVAGACIGVSCWLRANGLLLAPFLTLLLLFIFPRGLGIRRVKLALALLAGFLLILAPLTIRNAVVFGHFIPVSLGAGQTLLEGIGDYDEAARFGVPNTDLGIMQQEAEAHHRPDYAATLFGPDAIQRDRERLRRGFAIIRAHPFWFLSVVVRRAADMWRLERVPLISNQRLSAGWTRYPNAIVRAVQRLFITAVMLPLVLAGLLILIWRRQFAVLAILVAVPFYYSCTQSILHTEYRYVLTLHYFLFVIAAVAIRQIGSWGAERLHSRRTQPSRNGVSTTSR